MSCGDIAGPAQHLHWLADCERRLNPRGLLHLNYIPSTWGLTPHYWYYTQGSGHETAIFLPHFPTTIWLTKRRAGSLRGVSAIWYASIESGCPKLQCNEADQGLSYGNSWKRVRVVGFTAGWLHAGNLGAGKRG